MSPIDRAALSFVKHGVDFAAALERNYQDGFVFSTPDYFIMGREVAEGWFIEGMAGDFTRAWSILPYELPKIGFERFDNNLRFYPIETLRRMTNPWHEMALPT
jgi:hypothetical protein